MLDRRDLDWLLEECDKQDSLGMLAVVALSELRKSSKKWEIVCGPITTGGRGSPEANFEVFNAVIGELERQGRHIFSQMPYEKRIFSLRQQWELESPVNVGKYYQPVLDEFYLPIFESRLIEVGWFIPDWESSRGARWEQKQLGRVGASLRYLTEDWVNRLLVAA